MPTTLQFRRGNTTQNNAFTGAAGEISVDTTTNTLRVHDGSTAGGEQVVGLTATQTLTNKTLTSPTINGGTFSGTFTGTISPGAITTNSITSNGSNADISIQPSGTGDIILSSVRVNGTTLDSSDSSKITIAEALDVTGALTASGLAFPTSDGSANQFLKTDGSGNLAFADVSLGDFTFVGSTISNSSNADLSIQPSGTGDVLIGAIRINGTTLDSSDSTGININENVIIDGNLNVTGTVDFADQNISNVGSLSLDSISGDADSNTSITFSGSDVITMATGGSTAATFNADQTTTFNGAISSSGNITAGSSFIIGSADINETDLEKLDGITNGTVAANKAVVVDSNLDASGFRNVSATGTLTITGATSLNGGATVLGTITSGSLTTNNIVSNGSNADITIDPTGTGDINLTAGADVNLPADIGLTFGDDGEKIEGDGTDLTISTSNDVTIDAAGDIILDAGGADITLKDDGTTFGSITNTGGEVVIKSGSTPTVAATFAGNSVTFAGTVTAASVVQSGSNGITISDNNITTGSSNADIKIAPHGTGKVQFNGAYTFPTSDGSNGNALVTDGSGSLSFGTVGDPSASDLTDAVARKDKRLYLNRPRVIDKFDVTFCDSVLYYVCTNDYKNDIVNIQKLSVVHNNSEAFISGVGINNSAAIDMPVFTADVSGSLVVVKGEMTSDDSSIDAIGGSTTFLKLPLGDNSSAASSGNTELIVNSDIDSASESFDTFAHGTYRGAKYFISVNNDSKTECENVEVLVVHDGTDAYMTQYGGVRTGDDPLITVTAAISGSNVVVSIAGNEPNLRVTANIIRMKDTMVSDAGTYGNTEAIAPTTISSTATAIVDLDTVSKGNGAVIYVVGKNATEGAFSITEVFMAVSGAGDVSITAPGQVSTKSSEQLEFSTGFKDDEEATAQLLASSTSGGSTTCSAYRINLLAN